LGAAEQSDVKRVEEEARWLSSGVAAADDAALQAAIDAAAASDEAGVALYEAQFGSIAVGRLLAGSLAVNQYVESTGYDPGYAGWRIDADGSVEFNNAIFRGSIEGGSIDIGTGNSTFRVQTTGEVTIGAAYVNSYLSITESGTLFFGAARITYSPLNDELDISVGGLTRSGVGLALVGTRTTNATVLWDGTSDDGPNFTSFTSSHNHKVPEHRHQVYI
jgi:hypothetical protein